MEGQPETNQHIAGGPSQVTKRERDRGMDGTFSLWLWSQALSSGMENVLS